MAMRRPITLGLFSVALLIFGTVGHGQNKDAGGKSALPSWFKKLDIDADGQVSLWEWRRAGKALSEFKQWDRDRDGFITRDEAIPKKPAPSPAIPGKSGKNADAAADDDSWDSRPIVHRAGKLPAAGLPDWFKKLDIDRDGQVALWEWRAAGKKLDDFKLWDRDDDGFITPEEAMGTYAAQTTKLLQLTGETTEVRGELTPTGGKSPFPPSKNCWIYRVQLTADTTYVIDLESTAFDAYLSLADAHLRHIASDDDSGGNLNARIHFECKKDGIYHIVATGLGNAQGDYVLKIASAE
jgi:hypothetical protein